MRIETGAAEDSSGGGAWGVGDALDDAGHILAVAAAVTVVGLAILGPIALIALLAWLAHRAWVRRERRRVLSWPRTVSTRHIRELTRFRR